ncbi:type I-E CRISPR-associated protein Cse2/CasB [Paracoccus sp. YIM 132242]|uniref:Type I-E CRISPR-associated protein Cse2/CasB n=1 Tax=Paracoccus lichenicola TaxID=2665644 RepID=A0A6L6HR85_9RHOB|nr:type I-E CRISPR-associated protein Cse2/CasB [Paracoccus lichenicola]MTD99787.1 type I-E CRISPR-associated protein Cse2/CasB [Paracoccus lichenicola]
MTEDIGKTLSGWWREALRPADDTSAARALRARLRRADALEALAQPQVHDLVARAPWLRHRPKGLIRVVQVLAHVERNDLRSLARVLGSGDPPAMSRARFERLVRSEADELPRALRRAIVLTEGGCNVATLGRDVLNWDDPERGEDIRRNWYFDYFNAARDNAAAEGKTEDIAQ